MSTELNWRSWPSRVAVGVLAGNSRDVYVGRVKRLLLIIAALPALFTGCISIEPPIPPAEAIEAIIRDAANKPQGQLTREDYLGIRRLSLLDKEITGLQAMPVFSHALDLAELNLYDNQISDLTPISRLSKLRWLNLGRNRITDLTPLKKLDHLKQLYLYENPNLTVTQVAELQKALPNCGIHHNATK